jgi:hypothetical protein
VAATMVLGSSAMRSTMNEGSHRREAFVRYPTQRSGEAFYRQPQAGKRE